MNRRSLWILLVAVVAGVVAAVLYRWNRRTADGPAYVVDAESVVTGPAPEKETPNEWAAAREGGVYAGTVVEADGGAPIPNAQVLLVAYAILWVVLTLADLRLVRLVKASPNARLGVEFTSILTAQDIGSYKPDPRNFAALDAERRRLGIADGRLLHVAQSLFHDHVPAQRAGLTTVWINRRHDNPGWGATPQVSAGVTPAATYPSMAAFVEAVREEPTTPASAG